MLRITTDLCPEQQYAGDNNPTWAQNGGYAAKCALNNNHSGRRKILRRADRQFGIVPRITTGDHGCYSQHKLPQKIFLLCDSGRRKLERFFKNGEDENFFEGDAERILPVKLYLPGLLADTQFGNRMRNAVHRIVLWITTQHFLCLLWRIRGESGGKP